MIPVPVVTNVDAPTTRADDRAFKGGFVYGFGLPLADQFLGRIVRSAET
jgi:hypothetical protein